ncbi:RagB/SusD family nutrient uptake outer membrane protein [Arcticibacter sp.]|jgi:hypothetical protein|uniref:RagB/SusD family nutrient uptake outer membrane protein n=1 Tax=Arcticibacter sp. TaxID=1872630 RepID=UPI003890992B
MKRSLVVLMIATFFSACINKDDFFELEDRGGIDAAIWSTEGAVEMHLRETYDMSVPRFPFQDTYDRYPIHLASDENYFSGNDQWAKAALGLQGVLANNDVRFVGNKYQGNNFGDNRYFDIARTNNAITYIPQGTLPEAVKTKFLGQYHVLRAMNYFELVKVYGGVPLVLEPQTPSSLNVGGRASARECFDQIVKDLELGMEYLNGATWSDGSGTGRVTREIAAVLKAKVLLYWASPQFNPRNDGKHAYDAGRWNTALQANKEAYDICVAAGRKLMPSYAEIFRVEGASNTEAILIRSYSSTLERRGHNTENRVRPKSEGGSANNAFIPTTILLDSYPMKDGNPITSTDGSAKYQYDPVMFWQNRDPRFEATFAYNGSVWALSGKAGRKQWNYERSTDADYGIYSKKFATPSLTSSAVNYSNNLGGSGMDWIEIRFAEVMLNYAECLNETGDLAQAKNLVREIRKRAGIEEGNAGNDYGLATGGADMASMRELITNERMVEFAFENKRNADLRRLRKWHTLSGTIQTIRIGLNADGENALKAMKDLLEAPVPNSTALMRDTLNINNKSTYTKYFRNGTLTPSNIGPFTIPEYHYFYTFHNDFMYSSALLLPTIGWAGGIFDPLD